MDKRAFRIVGGTFVVIAVFLIGITSFSTSVLGSSHWNLTNSPYANGSSYWNYTGHPITNNTPVINGSNSSNILGTFCISQYVCNPRISSTTYQFQTYTCQILHQYTGNCRSGTQCVQGSSGASCRILALPGGSNTTNATSINATNTTPVNTTNATSINATNTTPFQHPSAINNPYGSFATFSFQKSAPHLTSCQLSLSSELFDPGTSGGVTFTYNNRQYTYNDRCDSSVALDYYCDAMGTFNYASYNCRFGCDSAGENCVTQSSTSTPTSSLCGNGVIDQGEECDAAGIGSCPLTSGGSRVRFCSSSCSCELSLPVINAVDTDGGYDTFTAGIVKAEVLYSGSTKVVKFADACLGRYGNAPASIKEFSVGSSRVLVGGINPCWNGCSSNACIR